MNHDVHGAVNVVVHRSAVRCVACAAGEAVRLFLADVAESDGPTKHFLAEGRTVRPRPRRTSRTVRLLFKLEGALE